MKTFDRQGFWKDPAASGYPAEIVDHCRPEFYIDLPEVTRLVVETVTKYAQPNWSIIELGSGTGRNLAGLFDAGFKKVSGIELNKDAVIMGRKAFPQIKKMPVTIAPVENALPDLPEYDVIFTQGLLMHLPPELDSVMELMKKKARQLIITIEGEHGGPAFHSWPHDYKTIFESGKEWHQVTAHSCEKWVPFPKTTVLRVFKKVLV